MTIDVAFFGFCAADAEARVSQAGKSWTRLRVGVGKDDAVQWVGVSAFGKAAETAARLKKMDRCYIEGAIKLDSWTGNDGVERHGLSVVAFKCERTHNIGRNKPHDDRPTREEPKPAPASGGAPPYDDDLDISF